MACSSCVYHITVPEALQKQLEINNKNSTLYQQCDSQWSLVFYEHKIVILNLSSVWVVFVLTSSRYLNMTIDHVSCNRKLPAVTQLLHYYTQLHFMADSPTNNVGKCIYLLNIGVFYHFTAPEAFLSDALNILKVSENHVNFLTLIFQLVNQEKTPAENQKDWETLLWLHILLATHTHTQACWDDKIKAVSGEVHEDSGELFSHVSLSLPEGWRAANLISVNLSSA